VRRPAVWVIVALTVVLAATSARAVRTPATEVATPKAASTPLLSRAQDSAITVVAAGDVACDPLNPSFNRGKGRGSWCRAAATAAAVDRLAPDAVLALGDLQYDDGRRTAYRKAYQDSWGGFRGHTHPVPGNHEYWSTSGAGGYFDYFGKRAGRRGRGWYSFDVGPWHLVALNSNCDQIACDAGSDQYRWLEADLAASSNVCTLAFMHHPLVSSGPHGDDPPIGSGPLWRLLYRAGVDVALAGHDHLYERFALLRPDGSKDVATGIRTFVIGTGGAQHYGVVDRAAYSQAVDSSSFGVLRLVLWPKAYGWRFFPVAGGTFVDEGTGSCHGAPAP
jgi:hypothetical protein